ncbi:hypothetical protein pb186bvf_015311 [Paramecium bursaria]
MLKAKSTKSSPVKMKQSFFPSIRQKTQIKQRALLIIVLIYTHYLNQEGLEDKVIKKDAIQKKYKIGGKDYLVRLKMCQGGACNQSPLQTFGLIQQQNKKKQTQQIQFRKATIKGRDKKYEWLLAQKGRQSVLVQTEPKIVIKRELSSSGSSVSSIPMDAQDTQRQGHDKRQFTLLNLDKFRIKPIMYQKHLATYTDRQEIPFVKRQITQFSTTTKASNSTNLYLRLGQQQLRRKV